MTDLINDPHAETKELMDKWAALQQQHGNAIKEIKALEDEIKNRIRKSGLGDIESDFAKGNVAPGSVRKSWDGKRLEGYATAHPEVLDFMTEKKSADRVSLKLKG